MKDHRTRLAKRVRQEISESKRAQKRQWGNGGESLGERAKQFPLSHMGAFDRAYRDRLRPAWTACDHATFFYGYRQARHAALILAGVHLATARRSAL